jgi:hypothetical protein
MPATLTVADGTPVRENVQLVGVKERRPRAAARR